MHRALGGCAGLVALTAAAVALAQTEGDRYSRVSGEWELAISEDQARAAIDRGIAGATDAMPPLVSSIAAGQLRSRTPAPRRITIAATASQVAVTMENRTFSTAPAVTESSRTTAGEPLEVTQRFRDEDLEQVFVTPNGTRWNTFVSCDGGASLRMDVVVQSPRLPAPMRFSLPYRRVR
jgi:hypothetical protein